MTAVIASWCDELRLSRSVTQSRIEADFANGFLLGEILFKYNQLSADEFKSFKDTDRADDLIRNFSLVQRVLARLHIKFTAIHTQRVIGEAPGVAARVLYELKTKLAVLERVEVGRPKPGAYKALANLGMRAPKPVYEAVNAAMYHSTLRVLAGNQKERNLSAALSTHATEYARLVQQRQDAHEARMEAHRQQLLTLRETRLQALRDTHTRQRNAEETGAREWAKNQALRQSEERARRYFLQRKAATARLMRTSANAAAARELDTCLDEFLTIVEGKAVGEDGAGPAHADATHHAAVALSRDEFFDTLKRRSMAAGTAESEAATQAAVQDVKHRHVLAREAAALRRRRRTAALTLARLGSERSMQDARTATLTSYAMDSSTIEVALLNGIRDVLLHERRAVLNAARNEVLSEMMRADEVRADQQRQWDLYETMRGSYFAAVTSALHDYLLARERRDADAAAQAEEVARELVQRTAQMAQTVSTLRETMRGGGAAPHIAERDIALAAPLQRSLQTLFASSCPDAALGLLLRSVQPVLASMDADAIAAALAHIAAPAAAAVPAANPLPSKTPAPSSTPSIVHSSAPQPATTSSVEPSAEDVHAVRSPHAALVDHSTFGAVAMVATAGVRGAALPAPRPASVAEPSALEEPVQEEVFARASLLLDACDAADYVRCEGAWSIPDVEGTDVHVSTILALEQHLLQWLQSVAARSRMGVVTALPSLAPDAPEPEENNGAKGAKPGSKPAAPPPGAPPTKPPPPAITTQDRKEESKQPRPVSSVSSSSAGGASAGPALTSPRELTSPTATGAQTSRSWWASGSSTTSPRGASTGLDAAALQEMLRIPPRWLTPRDAWIAAALLRGADRGHAVGKSQLLKLALRTDVSQAADVLGLVLGSLRRYASAGTSREPRPPSPLPSPVYDLVRIEADAALHTSASFLRRPSPDAAFGRPDGDEIDNEALAFAHTIAVVGPPHAGVRAISHRLAAELRLATIDVRALAQLAILLAWPRVVEDAVPPRSTLPVHDRFLRDDVLTSVLLPIGEAILDEAWQHDGSVETVEFTVDDGALWDHVRDDLWVDLAIAGITAVSRERRALRASQAAERDDASPVSMLEMRGWLLVAFPANRRQADLFENRVNPGFSATPTPLVGALVTEPQIQAACDLMRSSHQSDGKTSSAGGARPQTASVEDVAQRAIGEEPLPLPLTNPALCGDKLALDEWSALLAPAALPKRRTTQFRVSWPSSIKAVLVLDAAPDFVLRNSLGWHTHAGMLPAFNDVPEERRISLLSADAASASRRWMLPGAPSPAAGALGVCYHFDRAPAGLGVRAQDLIAVTSIETMLRPGLEGGYVREVKEAMDDFGTRVAVAFERWEHTSEELCAWFLPAQSVRKVTVSGSVADGGPSFDDVFHSCRDAVVDALQQRWSADTAREAAMRIAQQLDDDSDAEREERRARARKWRSGEGVAATELLAASAATASTERVSEMEASVDATSLVYTQPQSTQFAPPPLPATMCVPLARRSPTAPDMSPRGAQDGGAAALPTVPGSRASPTQSVDEQVAALRLDGSTPVPPDADDTSSQIVSARQAAPLVQRAAFAQGLLSGWNGVVDVYLRRMQDVMRSLRALELGIVQRTGCVARRIREFLRRPAYELNVSLRQFQSLYREVSGRIRGSDDAGVAAELRLRLEESAAAMWDAVDARELAAGTALKHALNDGWVEHTQSAIITSYGTLMQLETLRFTATRTLLLDYYTVADGGIMGDIAGAAIAQAAAAAEAALAAALEASETVHDANKSRAGSAGRFAGAVTTSRAASSKGPGGATASTAKPAGAAASKDAKAASAKKGGAAKGDVGGDDEDVSAAMRAVMEAAYADDIDDAALKAALAAVLQSGSPSEATTAVAAPVVFDAAMDAPITVGPSVRAPWDAGADGQDAAQRLHGPGALRGGKQGSTTTLAAPAAKGGDAAASKGSAPAGKAAAGQAAPGAKGSKGAAARAGGVADVEEDDALPPAPAQDEVAHALAPALRLAVAARKSIQAAEAVLACVEALAVQQVRQRERRVAQERAALAWSIAQVRAEEEERSKAATDAAEAAAKSAAKGGKAAAKSNAKGAAAPEPVLAAASSAPTLADGMPPVPAPRDAASIIAGVELPSVTFTCIDEGLFVALRYETQMYVQRVLRILRHALVHVRRPAACSSRAAKWLLADVHRAALAEGACVEAFVSHVDGCIRGRVGLGGDMRIRYAGSCVVFEVDASVPAPRTAAATGAASSLVPEDGDSKPQASEQPHSGSVSALLASLKPFQRTAIAAALIDAATGYAAVVGGARPFPYLPLLDFSHAVASVVPAASLPPSWLSRVHDEDALQSLFKSQEHEGAAGSSSSESGDWVDWRAFVVELLITGPSREAARTWLAAALRDKDSAEPSLLDDTVGVMVSVAGTATGVATRPREADVAQVVDALRAAANGSAHIPATLLRRVRMWFEGAAIAQRPTALPTLDAAAPPPSDDAPVEDDESSLPWHHVSRAHGTQQELGHEQVGRMHAAAQAAAAAGVRVSASAAAADVMRSVRAGDMNAKEVLMRVFQVQTPLDAAPLLDTEGLCNALLLAAAKPEF